MRYFFNPGHIVDVLVPHVKASHATFKHSNEHVTNFGAIVIVQARTSCFLYAISVKYPTAITGEPRDTHVMPVFICNDVILDDEGSSDKN